MPTDYTRHRGICIPENNLTKNISINMYQYM